MSIMETTVARIAFIVVLLLGGAGCPDPELKGLEGRWAGTIYCSDGASELTMHFTLEGDNLVGTAQTRYKDNNKAWQSRGQAGTSCEDDICRSSRDCPVGFVNSDAYAGELRTCVLNQKCADRCVKGDTLLSSCDPCANCTPCQVCDACSTDWLPVKVQLSDENVLIPDPTLKLWRIGSTLLKGSIFDYCTDEQTLHPVVELNKD